MLRGTLTHNPKRPKRRHEMKSNRTWVLIADGGHASVFETQGNYSDLAPVEDMRLSANLPANRDILTDRPGRSFESQGRARHAKENPSDPHRELKRAFAKKLGAVLKAKLAEKRFDHLVIVAPPSTLGDLRKILPKSTLSKVTAELAQDLVKIPQSELPRKLKDVLKR
jgi:protein required for attachment to host cells